jgi:hypothetical protein
MSAAGQNGDGQAGRVLRIIDDGEHVGAATEAERTGWCAIRGRHSKRRLDGERVKPWALHDRMQCDSMRAHLRIGRKRDQVGILRRTLIAVDPGHVAKKEEQVAVVIGTGAEIHTGNAQALVLLRIGRPRGSRGPVSWAIRTVLSTGPQGAARGNYRSGAPGMATMSRC